MNGGMVLVFFLVFSNELHRRQARRRPGFVDVRANSVFERAGREIDFANQARAVLIVDQRSAGAVAKINLRTGKPFLDDRGELRGGNALAAVVVCEVRELRFERKAYELLSAIVLVNPRVARLGPNGSVTGSPIAGFDAKCSAHITALRLRP